MNPAEDDARERAEKLRSEGNARRAGGDLEAAAASYRQVLDIDPGHLPALYNLGLVLHEVGRFEEAEAAFRRLLALAAADADALFHLGALLQRRGALDEAAETYRRATAHAPENAHLWIRLGDVAAARGSLEGLNEAAQHYARATSVQGDLADAHAKQGWACALLGRHDEALRSLRAAYALAPEDAFTQTHLLTQMQTACDWPDLGELIGRYRGSARREPAPEPALQPFGLLSIPSTLAEQLAGARQQALEIQRRAAGLAGAADARLAGARARRARERRLRIGYLSADFHEHVTAHVMAEVFELHDRDRFETIAYSCGPDDRSAARRRLESAFGRFVDLRPASDAQAASRIAGDGVDVLVDLKGYTRDARPDVVASRPAPIQASFLGYPATMGADFVDYIITDRFVLPPESAAFYAERPAYLPQCYYPGDRTRPRPEPASRRELGLPENAFVFCCFNQTFKILPEVFATWMRLLQQLPGAVLWLLEGNRWANENLRREASRHAIDPGRLVFAPRSAPEQYLRRLAAADLFLDTVPYNAHTTANDALWVGVPVLTCAGETLPSRVAASQLQAIGLPELIATSMSEYETLALRLARTPELVAGLGARLARNRDTSALFDTTRLVRGLESLYEAMWRIHAAGEAPRPIDA